MNALSIYLYRLWSLSLLPVLFCPVIHAQETASAVSCSTPCGYIVDEFRQGSTAEFGFGVHAEIIVAGEARISENLLTDQNADFTEKLNPDTAYILEIESGAYAGATCIINRHGWETGDASGQWDDHSLTLNFPPNLDIADGTVTYKLRKAPTIADVFGERNEKAQLAASAIANNADQILVPDGNGVYTTYFFNRNYWRKSQSSVNTNNAPFYYPDPVYIVRRNSGGSKTCLLLGEILESSRLLAVTRKEMLVNAGFACPQSLEQSLLSTNADWKASSISNNATRLWKVDPATQLASEYFYTRTMWRKSGAGSQDHGSSEIEGAMTIVNRTLASPHYLFIQNPYSTAGKTRPDNKQQSDL